MTSKRRPRGHIERRSNGSYRASVYAGVDPLTRKPRYLRETTTTRREAEVALTRLQNQVDEKRHPRSAITVAQAVDQWLKVATLEDSSRERYEDLIRIYIGPTLGEIQVGKLDAELLERFYARLQRCKPSRRPIRGRAPLRRWGRRRRCRSGIEQALADVAHGGPRQPDRSGS